ncbi:MAG: DUF3187 family protein [Planctomycetota bacterium]
MASRRLVRAAVACAVVAIGLALGSRSAAADDDPAAPDALLTPIGPAHVRNLSPLNTLRLCATPERPSLLAPQHVDIFADVTWSNLWARQLDYDLDLDQVWIDIDSRIGVLPWLELGVGLRVGWRGHAALAGLIQFWHRSFGYSERRDLRPPGLFIIRHNSVDVFAGEDEVAWGIGDITLQAKMPIVFDDAGTTGLSARLLLKLPVGESARGFASGGFDVGLQVNGMLTRDRFTGYAGVGYVRLAQTVVWTFAPAEHQFVAWLGVEVRLGPEVAIVATLDLQTAVATDVTVLSAAQMEFHFGLAFTLRRGMILWLSFLENTFAAESAIDMGWHVGLRWTP